MRNGVSAGTGNLPQERAHYGRTRTIKYRLLANARRQGEDACRDEGGTVKSRNPDNTE